MDGTRRLTMLDLVNDYMDRNKDDWAKTTQRAYRSLYDDFAAKWDGQSPRRAPNKIDRLWVDDYFVGPDGIGRRSAPRSYNIRRTQLRAFVLWAIDRGHFKAGAWPEKLRRRRGAPRDKLRLTNAEMDRMMDRADPYDRWVIALLRYTLLRESEALRISVGDVTICGDGELSTIRVLRTKAAREDGQLHYDDLPMMGELVDEYHRWIAEYAKLIGGEVLNSYPLVPRWVGKSPSRACPHLTRYLKVDKAPSTVRPLVKKRLRLLYPDFSPAQLQGTGSHTMRRSGAVEMRNALEAAGHADPIAIVQYMLDHTTKKQTMVYLGITGERDRRNKALRELGRLRDRPGLRVASAGRDAEAVS